MTYEPSNSSAEPTLFPFSDSATPCEDKGAETDSTMPPRSQELAITDQEILLLIHGSPAEIDSTPMPRLSDLAVETKEYGETIAYLVTDIKTDEVVAIKRTEIRSPLSDDQIDELVYLAHEAQLEMWQRDQEEHRTFLNSYDAYLATQMLRKRP